MFNLSKVCAKANHIRIAVFPAGSLCGLPTVHARQLFGSMSYVRQPSDLAPKS